MFDKTNSWLISDKFLIGSKQKDKEFLRELFSEVYDYVTCLPIPVYTAWNDNYRKIYFIHGQHRKGFFVNGKTIGVKFINLIEDWISQFYPFIVYHEKEHRELTEKEILVEMNQSKGFDPTMLDKTVEEKVYNKYLFFRSYLLQDLLVTKRIRKCKNRKFDNEWTIFLSLKPLSLLLKELRNIEIIKLRTQFFFEHVRDVTKSEMENLTNRGELIYETQEVKTIKTITY